MNTMDATDIFMMLFTAALITAGTVFLFKNPNTANFGIWAGLLTCQGGVFHGLRIWDQKTKDAGQ
jgi:hypothetical protein